MTGRRAILALLLVAVTAVSLPAESIAAKKGGKFGARTLQAGSRGKDVRTLQRSLTTLGFSTRVNGVFAGPTRKSVKALEAQQQWPVNGIVSRGEARRITKLVAQRRAKKPEAIFYLYGPSSPAVTVTAAQAGSARLDVVDINSGLIAQTIPLSFNGRGDLTPAWNGLAGTGTYAPDGSYRLVLGDPGTAGATLSGGQTQAFLLRGHAFPLPTRHTFGGKGARFGARRPGHVHQGQDVLARCGRKLIAAEGGTVSVNAYQAGGAGNYVVIRGVITGTDYVYMHLKKPSWAPPGTILYTGQGIGKVGATGAASGCHLHFEHWVAPGWFQGGSPYDPLPELTYWDGYS